MWIKDKWQQFQGYRAQKFIANNTPLVLDVLRQSPQTAALAVRTLYEMEARGDAPKRETYQYPQLTFGGGMRPLQRTLPKLAPAALRAFSDRPPARRAINALSNPILDLNWAITLKRPIGHKAHDKTLEPSQDQQARIEAATDMFTQPNNEMSWRELLEMVLEDICVLGAGSLEVEENDSDKRPLFLWPVDTQSIRINCGWKPGGNIYRYSQARGYMYSALGTTDDIFLQDDELLYMRLNPRTHTPFGLGYLEVAFETVNSFIGAAEFASRRASNATPLFGIFLGENVTIDQVRVWQHYWENEIEGYGKVPILGGGRQPSVFSMQGNGDDALFLKWQEWLVRVIAMSFGLSPMKLGIERDVNRSTAQTQSSDDWSTIAPIAGIVKDALTHWLLWRRLGWRDLEFSWIVKTADEQKQADIMFRQYESNAITVDEIRQAYERPPLEDGMGNHTKSAYESLFNAKPMSGEPDEEDASVVTPFDHEARADTLSAQERAFMRDLLQKKSLERQYLAAVAT